MQWTQGNTFKEKYLKARSHVYQVKWEAEKNIFGDIIQRDDQKCYVFDIVKSMMRKNQDAIEVHSVKMMVCQQSVIKIKGMAGKILRDF